MLSEGVSDGSPRALRGLSEGSPTALWGSPRALRGPLGGGPSFFLPSRGAWRGPFTLPGGPSGTLRGASRRDARSEGAFIPFGELRGAFGGNKKTSGGPPGGVKPFGGNKNKGFGAQNGHYETRISN